LKYDEVSCLDDASSTQPAQFRNLALLFHIPHTGVSTVNIQLGFPKSPRLYQHSSNNSTEKIHQGIAATDISALNMEQMIAMAYRTLKLSH
jgi:hypothetical protein